MLSSTHRWSSDVEVLPVHQGEVAVDLPLHFVLFHENLTYQAPCLRREGHGGGAWGGEGEDEKRRESGDGGRRIDQCGGTHKYA